MTELDQVANEIKSYHNQIAVGEMLERLSDNKDFKELILNGFLRENAIRLVHLKSHPGQQTPEKQAAILRQIDAVGSVEDFLRGIRQQSALAREGLKNSEALRVELLKEAGHG